MANLWNNEAKLRLVGGAAGAILFLTEEIVIIAVETNDDPDDPDTEFVGGAGATFWLDSGDAVEVSSTGYVGGFAGADRLSLDQSAAKTIAVDQAGNRAEFDCGDLTWTAISQAAAETWVGFGIAKELTSDALSPMMWQIDTATGLPLTPNGSDITLQVDAEGIAQIT